MAGAGVRPQVEFMLALMRRYGGKRKRDRRQGPHMRYWASFAFSGSCANDVHGICPVEPPAEALKELPAMNARKPIRMSTAVFLCSRRLPNTSGRLAVRRVPARLRCLLVFVAVVACALAGASDLGAAVPPRPNRSNRPSRPSLPRPKPLRPPHPPAAFRPKASR